MLSWLKIVWWDNERLFCGLFLLPRRQKSRRGMYASMIEPISIYIDLCSEF